MRDGRDGDDAGPVTAAPDVPAAVAGWRCFDVGPSGTDLVSPVVRASWPPGRPSVAVCDLPGVIMRDHTAPDPECTCGLYSGREPPADYLEDADLLGCVAFWGRIVEGERGYRAERGYPAVLFASSAVTEKQCLRIAERYAVPVHRLPVEPGELLLCADVLNRSAERVRAAATGSDPERFDAAVDAMLTEVTAAALLGRARRNRAVDRRVGAGRYRTGSAVTRIGSAVLDALIGIIACVVSVAVVVGLLAGLDALVGGPATPLFPMRQASVPPPGTCIATEQEWDVRTGGSEDGCTGEHWGEVLGTRPLGPVPSAYPGDDQVAATATFECRWLLAARGLPETAYRARAAIPDRASWNPGGGEYENYTTCAVTTASGDPLPAGRLVDPGRAVDGAADVPTGVYYTSVGSNAPTGACVGPGPLPIATDPVPLVRCDRAHRAEVLGYPSLSPPGTPWPGDDAVHAAAVSACDRLDTARRPPGGFSTTPIWPARSWFDDPTLPHYATCLLVRDDGGAWAGTPR